MKKEFSNAKVQTSTLAKTRNLSKLLLAVLLSVVLFGGAMFLLFANHTAPVQSALAETSSTLPTTLTEAPVFTYDSSAGTITGTDKTINGYNFKDDVYYATISTNQTIGGVTYPYVVTLTKYTPTTPTQVVVPSQMIINGNTYQVVNNGSFSQYSVITSISFASVGGTKVLATVCGHMFYNCSKLISLDLSNLDTSNVSLMYDMFRGCSSLTSLDLSSFNISNVTDMRSMFYGCYNLTSLNVSNFDTSNVTNMSEMFYECSSLTSLDVSRFDTSNVTDIWGMFGGCSSLTSLDVSKFDTSNVTGMSGMFSNCSSLNSLDVSKFDTSNVTDMSYMFENVNANILDLSSFVFKADCDVENMFGQAPTKSDEEMAETLYGEKGVVAKFGPQVDSLLQMIDNLDENDEKIEIVGCRSDISKCKITETRDDFLKMTKNQKTVFYDNFIKKYATIICADQYFSAETEAERAQYLPTEENVTVFCDQIRSNVYEQLGFSANLGTYAQIQSIVLPATVNGLSIALPAGEYAVNGNGKYAYTTLKGYNDLTTPNGISYEEGTTLQNKSLVPETPTSTGVETSLLFALSGAVVIALFAVAVVSLNKKKRVVRK